MLSLGEIHMARCTGSVAPLLLFFLLLFSFSQAVAQRGAEFSETTPPQSLPGAGFPGLFDSRLAEAGKFSLDIPSLSADYGVNDRLTIGTNGWTLAALALGAPVVYAKMRYRFYSNSSVSSVHTVYFGGTSNALSKASTKASGVLFGLSNNTSFLVGDSGEITSTLFYSQINYSQEDKETLVYSKFSASFLLAGATYQNWLTDWFGPSLMMLVTPYISVDADSSGGAVSAQVAGNQFLMARASAEFMAGKSWLLSPGIYSFVSFSGSSSPIAFPVFSAAVKW
jgi:hypothetical protein